MRTALRNCLLFAALIAAGSVLTWTVDGAKADDGKGFYSERKGSTGRPAPYYGVGGYSMTLSDVWGPAEMPPAPTDFGPHFDFPPQALGGGLTHDPYPN